MAPWICKGITIRSMPTAWRTRAITSKRVRTIMAPAPMPTPRTFLRRRSLWWRHWLLLRRRLGPPLVIRCRRRRSAPRCAASSRAAARCAAFTLIVGVKGARQRTQGGVGQAEQHACRRAGAEQHRAETDQRAARDRRGQFFAEFFRQLSPRQRGGLRRPHPRWPAGATTACGRSARRPPFHW